MGAVDGALLHGRTVSLRRERFFFFFSGVGTGAAERRACPAPGWAWAERVSSCASSFWRQKCSLPRLEHSGPACWRAFSAWASVRPVRRREQALFWPFLPLLRRSSRFSGVRAVEREAKEPGGSVHEWLRLAAVDLLLLGGEEGIAQMAGALYAVLGLGALVLGQRRGDAVQRRHGLALRALVAPLGGQFYGGGGTGLQFLRYGRFRLCFCLCLCLRLGLGRLRHRLGLYGAGLLGGLIAAVFSPLFSALAALALGLAGLGGGAGLGVLGIDHPALGVLHGDLKDLHGIGMLLDHGDGLFRCSFSMSLQHGHLSIVAEGDGGAPPSGPAGAADAVDIGLRHLGQVVVDHAAAARSMSMPRAAMSVATSTRMRPRLEVGQGRHCRAVWRLVAVDGARRRSPRWFRSRPPCRPRAWCG